MIERRLFLGGTVASLLPVHAVAGVPDGSRADGASLRTPENGEAALRRRNLRIPVDGLSGTGAAAELAITVCAPVDTIGERPVVVFAFPGGGFSRHYYDLQIPGHRGFSQAEHHCARGIIFVACDHLGVGESTIPNLDDLTIEILAKSMDLLVTRVVERLRAGTLMPGLDALEPAAVIGMGQSMGGCLLIAAQGQMRVFDAVAVLGFSGRHTVLPVPPGAAPLPTPQFPRGMHPRQFTVPSPTRPEQFRYVFHFEDVPPDIVALDMGDGRPRGAARPAWRSATTPPVARTMMSSGVIAPEAAAIDVPVMVAFGERDVSPDPHAEPAAFHRSSDISLLILPRMAHMHNFAGTRTILWNRLVSWSQTIAPRSR